MNVGRRRVALVAYSSPPEMPLNKWDNTADDALTDEENSSFPLKKFVDTKKVTNVQLVTARDLSPSTNVSTAKR